MHTVGPLQAANQCAAHRACKYLCCHNAAAAHTAIANDVRNHAFNTMSLHADQPSTLTPQPSHTAPTFTPPLFTSVQVLQAVSKLVETSKRPEPGALVDFLRGTDIIRSCDDVDALVGVLQARRGGLLGEERAVQAHLLRLFLEQARCALVLDWTVQCLLGEGSALQAHLLCLLLQQARNAPV